MMYTHLRKLTITKIEQMCREFLWGHNKMGSRKVPLVAWARIIKLQKHGGLGIKDTSVHATALMARWPIKLLTDPNSTWSRLFQANLESLPWVNKKMQRRLGYTFIDKVMFGQPSGFGKLQYTKNIWNAWSELRKHLSYNLDGNIIPSYWSIADAIKITPSSGNYCIEQQSRIFYFFG
jgi:hypothetical protein